MSCKGKGIKQHKIEKGQEMKRIKTTKNSILNEERRKIKTEGNRKVRNKQKLHEYTFHN